MTDSNPSILFLGKRGDSRCQRAGQHIEENFPGSRIEFSDRDGSIPDDLVEWRGDYIISYLYPHIVPGAILANASRAAINFHPGPPEYPGIGCTNQALYRNESIFGVTCHHMAQKVDTGNVIAVRRFPVTLDDDVFSLTQRCYEEIEILFFEIANIVANNDALPIAPNEHWTRQPFTREELNDLCRIEHDMTVDEVERRIRAVTFPDAPGAYIEFHGYKFCVSHENSTK